MPLQRPDQESLAEKETTTYMLQLKRIEVPMMMMMLMMMTMLMMLMMLMVRCMSLNLLLAQVVNGDTVHWI